MAKDKKVLRRLKIKRRFREAVQGNSECPRLCVYRSNKEIYAQVIDDSQAHTLLAASSREEDVSKQSGTKVEMANLVGKKIAERAIEKGIKQVKFDRNGYLYHGRIKSLADGAREAGLEF